MSDALYLQNFKNISKLENLEESLEIAQNSAKILKNDLKNGKIASINVILEEEDLNLFEDLASLSKPYSKVLILGVGGSSLGGKTLNALNQNSKLEFLESIDPQTIQNCLNKIDFNDCFFLVISKSGNTIETICQTLIILEKFKELNLNDFAKQFLFVTEEKDNPLRRIANEINAKCAPHREDIGGRFSCFSITGILPAIIAGIDGKKIRNGAKHVMNDFLNGNDDIIKSCAIQNNLYQKGFKNNVIMPYIDSLKNFTDWYRQIWAESLGKENFGSIPINSMGTIDQHSQLQLYLEGPKDKFFTFITNKNHPNDYLVKDLPNCPTLFGNKKLSDIVKVEQETTIEVLNQKNLPIRTIEIDNLNEEVLGGLMIHIFLETILTSYIQNINPFDQPAVELRKNLAKKLLNNGTKIT